MSLSSVGSSDNGGASLYQLLMQELQSASIGGSVSTLGTAVSLNPASAAIDRVLFSGASASAAPSGQSGALDSYQQYLARLYRASQGGQG